MVRTTLCIISLLVCFNVYAEKVDEIDWMLASGMDALSHPEKIKETSQKIQDYFSDPKNSSQLESPKAKKLAQIQSKLINYLRLSESLGHADCNLDPTRRSARGEEIVLKSLEAPMCSNWETSFLKQHNNLGSLIEDVKIIEERSYIGAYTVNEKGDLLFPWEEQDQKARDKLNWKTVLPDVAVGATPSTDQTTIFRDELYKQSLKDSFKTYLHLHTAFGEINYGPETLAKKFCKEKKGFFSHFEKKTKPVVCPESIQKFLGKLAREHQEQRRPISFAETAKTLNAKIDELNIVGKRLAQNSELHYDPFMQAKAGKYVVDNASFKDREQAQKDYSVYLKLHAELTASGPGILTATDSLQSKAGLKSFSAMSFQKPHPPVTPRDVWNAVREAQDYTFDHGQELLSIYHSDSKDDKKISDLLKLNPVAASQVLLNRPELGDVACRGLKGIFVDELDDRQKRLVAFWGGSLVGGVISFSSLGLVPLVVSSIAVMTPDVVFTYQKYQEALVARDGFFSENNGKKALEANELYHDAKFELGRRMVTAGLVVMSDVTAGLKAGEAVKGFKTFVPNFVKGKSLVLGKTPPRVFGIEYKLSTTTWLISSKTAQHQKLQELQALSVSPRYDLSAPEVDELVANPLKGLQQMVRRTTDKAIQREAFETLKKFSREISNNYRIPYPGVRYDDVYLGIKNDFSVPLVIRLEVEKEMKLISDNLPKNLP